MGKTNALRRAPQKSASASLATLVARNADHWIINLAGEELEALADPVVDPLLLVEALEHGSMVLVNPADSFRIVGVVATRRSVMIDSAGRVDLQLASLRISVQSEWLLQSPGTYIRAGRRELSLYGNTVAARANDVLQFLGSMIKLN